MPPNLDSEGGGDLHHQAADHTTTNTSTPHSAGYRQDNCTTGRCAVGTACVCESVAEQLRRRRAASYRLPRLQDGRRDPISQSRW